MAKYLARMWYKSATCTSGAGPRPAAASQHCDAEGDVLNLPKIPAVPGEGGADAPTPDDAPPDA
jgi:hypothetical protein